MRERADTVVLQEWLHVSRAGDSLPMRNVLGRFNLDAPTRLLFLAHWDTRPKAEGGQRLDAQVVALPFYDPDNARQEMDP